VYCQDFIVTIPFQISYSLWMVNLFQNLLFIQSLGGLAFVVGMYAFLSQQDKKFKILQAIQHFILSAHFLLLGAESGAAVTFISGIRNLSALYNNLKKIAPIFLIFYLVIGIYRYEVWVDSLPIISSVLGTVALFYLSGIKMRLLMLPSTCL